MVHLTKMKTKKLPRGFTLVELLVATLILAVVGLAVGQGFARLSALEEMNREKARTLEAVCQRYAWTQPFVAVGSSADSYVQANRIDVNYPHVVFGIACETNRFTQVTNCVVIVTNGVLQTTVNAGVITGLKGVSTRMDWLDPIFKRDAQPSMTRCGIAKISSNMVAITYCYEFTLDGRTDAVATTVPIRLRNNGY